VGGGGGVGVGVGAGVGAGAGVGVGVGAGVGVGVGSEPELLPPLLGAACAGETPARTTQSDKRSPENLLIHMSRA